MSDLERAVWNAIEKALSELGNADIQAGIGWESDAPNAEEWQAKVAHAAIEAVLVAPVNQLYVK